MPSTRAALLCIVLCVTAAAQSPLPLVEHYDYRADLDPKARSASFVAELRLRNDGKRPVRELPLLLYRLFTVDSVSYQGRPARFQSRIVTDRDSQALQVNFVTVQLAPALAPGKTAVLRLAYHGQLHGYREVWGYVRDTISPEYSLLRLDTFAYPIIALPTAQSRHALPSRFTYVVEACVPEGFTVAAGGRITNTRASGAKQCTEFTSLAPTWRIDLAAAKFSTAADAAGRFRAYVLPGHEEGAKRVLRGVERCLDLFAQWFGPPDSSGYTVIEVPDGWGSQASDFYFLQTAAAFEDPKRIGEVYHELGHGFDVTPAPSVARSRFFDEAFASYFESLAVAQLDGADLAAEMEQSRDLFQKWAAHDRKYADTPIADYGKHEMGQMSYSKGAYALYVLHQLLGDDRFRQLIRELRRESQVAPLDFARFQQVSERVAGRDLRRFFAEWFFGAESSELLRSKVPASEIIARYR